MAGGGGLIQLPALATLRPELGLSNLLAINKASSICGTFTATWSYLRTIRVDWRVAAPATVVAFIFSGLGAWVILELSSFDLKPLIVIILVMVFIYTLYKKNFGEKTQITRFQSKPIATACVGIAAPIGFYDGFFGPGTGGFFTFLLIRLLGYDFLKATAVSKILNFSTNCAAVAYFVLRKQIIFSIALPMAAANVTGGLIGSRLALTKGNLFVRKIFLVVTFLLIAKMGYDVVAATL